MIFISEDPIETLTICANPQTAELYSFLQEKYRNRWNALIYELKNTMLDINQSMELIEQMHPEVLQFDNWPQATDNLQYLYQMLSYSIFCEDRK